MQINDIVHAVVLVDKPFKGLIMHDHVGAIMDDDKEQTEQRLFALQQWDKRNFEIKKMKLVAV